MKTKTVVISAALLAAAAATPAFAQRTAPLGQYSRLKTGFRLIIGIPVMLLAIIMSVILYVCSIIAWFAILFTGKLAEGLFNPMRSAMAYLVRTTGYFLLITEDWPPFSFDEDGTVPAGQIPSESPSSTPEA